jgi:hypothetical protein
VRKPHQGPVRLRTGQRPLDANRLAVPGNSQHGPAVCRSERGRPIREVARDHDAQHLTPTDEFDSSLEPVPFVDPDHHASLIVEFLICAQKGYLGGEIAAHRAVPHVPVIADEAVMRHAPEVGPVSGKDREFSVLIAP